MGNVLAAELQQDPVQLLDVVLRQRDVLPGIEDGAHRFGIPGHLLLVSGAERVNVQVRQQDTDLVVGEPCPLDPGGGSH